MASTPEELARQVAALNAEREDKALRAQQEREAKQAHDVGVVRDHLQTLVAYLLELGVEPLPVNMMYPSNDQPGRNELWGPNIDRYSRERYVTYSPPGVGGEA